MPPADLRRTTARREQQLTPQGGVQRTTASPCSPQHPPCVGVHMPWRGVLVACDGAAVAANSCMRRHDVWLLHRFVVPSCFLSKYAAVVANICMRRCVWLISCSGIFSHSFCFCLALSYAVQVTRGLCLPVEDTDIGEQECVRYDCEDTQGSCPPEGYPVCDG